MYLQIVALVSSALILLLKTHLAREMLDLALEGGILKPNRVDLILQLYTLPLSLATERTTIAHL